MQGPVERFFNLLRMKRSIACLVCFLSVTVAAYSNTVVKVALVDQLMSQKLSSINYAQDYMKGISTAISAIHSKFGIQIILKTFPYGKTYLGPLKVMPAVAKWQPNVVIGPRSSSKFLLLKPYFKKILVISPFATSGQVYRLPGNFYSMSLSDKYMGAAIASFALKHFSDSHGALILDAVDCLSCHTVASRIRYFYKHHAKHKIVIWRSFIGNNVEHVDIKKLTVGWKNRYLIFSTNISYVSGVLITRIANYLNKRNLVFLGADEWGKHEVGYIGQLKTKHPFSAYHLQDWSLTHGNADLSLFKKYYARIYKKAPTDPVSYASFHALFSVFSTVNVRELKHAKNKTQFILKKFQQYVVRHKNAFRQKYFVIYHWDHQSNKDVIAAVIEVKNDEKLFNYLRNQ